MNENQVRTLDNINEILQLAKLNENDIVPTSQAVYFQSNGFNDSNLKFLELDSHLHGIIKEGQTLYIKGDDDENVVLCTENRTYDVTSGETSNSLLLIEKMSFFDDLKDTQNRSFNSIEVSGIFHDFLVVTPSKPHLEKLMDLLNKSVYKGPEHEYEIKAEDLYSFEDLNNMIQASETELKEVLTDLDTVKLNQKIRLLDVEFHFRVLSYMLKLIDENSWALDEVDYEETLNSLKDLIPEEVLISLFEKYTVESKIIDSLQLYSYKEQKVCKFFAQILLYAAEKFNLDDFLQAWRQSVPEGMIPDEDLLNGIAIIDHKTNTISAFPEDSLPLEINARFKMLFQIKEKWTVPEITPYIQALTTPNMDVNAVLAKFARASTVQGVKYYSAKHGK